MVNTIIVETIEGHSRRQNIANDVLGNGLPDNLHSTEKYP